MNDEELSRLLTKALKPTGGDAIEQPSQQAIGTTRPQAAIVCTTDLGHSAFIRLPPAIAANIAHDAPTLATVNVAGGEIKVNVLAKRGQLQAVAESSNSARSGQWLLIQLFGKNDEDERCLDFPLQLAKTGSGPVSGCADLGDVDGIRHRLGDECAILVVPMSTPRPPAEHPARPDTRLQPPQPTANTPADQIVVTVAQKQCALTWEPLGPSLTDAPPKVRWGRVSLLEGYSPKELLERIPWASTDVRLSIPTGASAGSAAHYAAKITPQLPSAERRGTVRIVFTFADGQIVPLALNANKKQATHIVRSGQPLLSILVAVD